MAACPYVFVLSTAQRARRGEKLVLCRCHMDCNLQRDSHQGCAAYPADQLLPILVYGRAGHVARRGTPDGQ